VPRLVELGLRLLDLEALELQVLRLGALGLVDRVARLLVARPAWASCTWRLCRSVAEMPPAA